jgi:hypothetical protein
MSSGNWSNADGLFLQFGTAKATPEVGGDYKSYGEWRDIEVLIDLTTLTSSAAIVSNTTFFPGKPSSSTAANYGQGTLLVDSVEVQTLVGATGGTSFSVGLANYNANTSPATVNSISDTAFVNAMVTASVAAPGDRTDLTTGSTYAGGYVGTPTITAVGNISAKASGTYSAGQVLVRIRYRFFGTISQ